MSNTWTRTHDYSEWDADTRDEEHRAYLDDLGAEQLAQEQEALETRPPCAGCYWCGAVDCVCESNAELEANRQAGRG